MLCSGHRGPLGKADIRPHVEYAHEGLGARIDTVPCNQ